MAGDEYAHEPAEIAPPNVDDPFPTIAETLRAMLDSQRMVGYEIVGPLSVAAGTAAAIVSQYPKLRVQWLIVSLDIAAVVALGIGTVRYPFAVVPGVNRIPLPIVIERGTDVSLTFSVAVTAHAYLIGPTE